MTTENVIPMPDTLERLSRDVMRGLFQRDEGHSQWIEGTVAIAIALAAARAIQTDRQFGEWCERSFGKFLKKDERANLAAMGQDPARLRKLLEDSDRRSIQTIYRHEWTVRNVTNHSPSRGRRGEKMPALDRAREAVAPFMDSGAAINTRKLGAEIGVSHVKIDEAIAAEKGRREAIAELKADPLPIDPSTLPKTAQEKLAAALRQQKRQQDAEYAARLHGLNEEVRQRVVKEGKAYREHFEAAQEKHLAREDVYRRLIDNHKVIFTVEQFKTIVMCLHPDNSASVETREEGFRLFTAKKLQLTKAQ